MMIFADKETGEITGLIFGRIHGQEQKNVWVGDKDKNIRIVIQYIASASVEKEIEQNIQVGRELDADGFFKPIFKKVKKIISESIFVPAVKEKEQQDIIIAIENGANYREYKIDLKTKKFIKITGV